MKLSNDQRAARDAVLDAMQRGEQVMVLVGPAGSGKTTLMRTLLDTLHGTRPIALLCPTGKAAARLTEVVGQPARTVHRAIYGAVDDVAGELVFGDQRSPCPPGGLVICDEASMVDQRLHDDLLDHLAPGAQLLYVGDREQLPPVSGRWGPDFSTPTAVLETIHRQAERSPILGLATSIRQRKAWSGWTPGVCERRTDGDPITWFTQHADRDATLITMTNQRRTILNRAVREAMGWADKAIVAGERLLCLYNNTQANIMNGEVHKVLKARRSVGLSYTHQAEIWDVELDTVGPVLVNADLMGGSLDAFQAWRGRGKGVLERAVHVDYGSCLTVHKAQGSQWEHVGFVSCPAFRRMGERRRRLAYTAITRARTSLVIFVES